MMVSITFLEDPGFQILCYHGKFHDKDSQSHQSWVLSALRKLHYKISRKA